MIPLRLPIRGFRLLAALVLGAQPCAAAALRLDAPLEYAVGQRGENGGSWPIQGTLSASLQQTGTVEGRLIDREKAGPWITLATLPPGQTNFHARFNAPAGGWYRLEVRLRNGNEMLASTNVAHVGIGEVFVIAGQSNSANHGQERQQPQTGLVVNYHRGRWQLANDPQRGASGDGGSFIPPFGDALAQRFHVPVGIIATGVGATSVREWLPRDVAFPNPPTLTGQVKQRADGTWESQGALYNNLVARMKELGPGGFRAVLWHQGESDANQRDATRTLPGKLYEEFLTRVIEETRRAAGWTVPWFVAQASYHTPDDTGSPEIREAQHALWTRGVALEGPDTDALIGDLREHGGQGVHFSGPGLRTHGARWAEKVSSWLANQPGVARTNSTSPVKP